MINDGAVGLFFVFRLSSFRCSFFEGILPVFLKVVLRLSWTRKRRRIVLWHTNNIVYMRLAMHAVDRYCRQRFLDLNAGQAIRLICQIVEYSTYVYVDVKWNV